jgi:hypothetical protein
MSIDHDAPLAPRPEQHVQSYDERFDARFDYYLNVRHFDSATARQKTVEDVGPDPDAETTEPSSDEERNRLIGKLGVEGDIDFISRKMAGGLSFVEANALMLARREHNTRDY